MQNLRNRPFFSLLILERVHKNNFNIYSKRSVTKRIEIIIFGVAEIVGTSICKIRFLFKAFVIQFRSPVLYRVVINRLVIARKYL